MSICLGNINLAVAQEALDFDLEQLVVTATKTPVKEFEANANITVITNKDIENNHYPNLSEALRNVPGVTIANYGGGVGYDYSNWFRINGTDKVVVLVDGVRVNTGGISYPTQAINSLNNIERIEVLKGSASALYGSDAQGGVINIITKKVKGNKTNLTLVKGSYDKESYSLNNQSILGPYTWSVTAKKDILGDFTDAEGYKVKQYSNSDNLNFKLTKQLNEDSDLAFNYNEYKADKMYTDTKYTTEHDPYGAARYGKYDNYDWRLIYNYKPSSDISNQMLFYNTIYRYDYTNANPAKLPNGNYIKTMGFQEQFSKKIGEKNQLTSGFDFVQDKVVNYYASGKTYGDKKITNRAVYLQDEWDLSNRLKLTSGVRFDSHSIYGSHTTPRVNLGYKLNERTNYYVAYNEFFTAPTPSQLYSAYGNLDLKPETGHSLEAGMNHRFSKTLAGTFHAFERSSTNMIVYFAPKYENAGQEKAHGWDVQLNKSLSQHLNAFAGYTYLHVDPNGGSTALTANYNGRMPKGMWNVGADYAQDKYDAHLKGRGIIDRPGLLKPGSVNKCFPESTFWIWDLALNYKVNKDVKAFITVNNIFDKFYADMSTVWNVDKPENWWTNPGRNYQFGVEYNF